MKHNFKLTKLLNFEHIKEIFKSIKDITGLEITLLDDEGNLLISAKGECKYCKLNTLVDNGKKCRISDIEAVKIARKQKSIYIYRCYAGLNDAVIPLFYEKNFIGAVVTGQVFVKDSPLPNFANLKNTRVEISKLKKAFNEVPIITYKSLTAACNLIFHIFNYIIESEIKKLMEIEKSNNYDRRVEMIKKIKNFIELNYKEDICLNKFAQMFNVNTYYISKLFKRIVGINYKDYLMNLRIEAAKRFLSYSNMSISDIAYRVGFNDSNYFSVQFKKRVGVLPKDFRRDYKGKY